LVYENEVLQKLYSSNHRQLPQRSIRRDSDKKLPVVKFKLYTCLFITNAQISSFKEGILFFK